MMDDRFMHELKAAPDPGFGRRLRERLRAMEAEADEREPRARWVALLAPALLVALLASAILFPSVRASAQAFLDLFRVRNFTAVSVSPDRVKQLQDGKLDLESLIGDRVQAVTVPSPPQVVMSAAQAGAATGLFVKVPTTLPAGLQADTVSWRGAGEAEVTADVGRLHRVLDALEIRDVSIPTSIDGQKIDIKMSPVVRQRFVHDKLRADLLQAKSPEVGLPAGVNLAELGEIGLRILGLSATEARRLAQSIDWRSTMLIPVPANVGSFRQVDVNGNPGLIVTIDSTSPDAKRQQGSIVLWSQDDMVYALSGNLSGVDMLQMANSVR